MLILTELDKPLSKYFSQQLNQLLIFDDVPVMLVDEYKHIGIILNYWPH